MTLKHGLLSIGVIALFGCTESDPEFSQVSGASELPPVFDKTNSSSATYTITDVNVTFDVPGTCTQRVNSLEWSENSKDWTVVTSALSAFSSIDSDCQTDGVFTLTFDPVADLSFTDGVYETKTFYLRANSGYLQSPASVITVIYQASAAPTWSDIAISINSGAAQTSSTAVTLGLTSSEAAEMYITNTAGCVTGGAWETITATKSWTLANPNSPGSVYVKFRDSSSNESSCISDSILHDDQPPTVAGSWVLSTGHNSFTNDSTPTISNTSITDGVGGTFRIFNDTSCATEIANQSISSGSVSLTAPAYATGGDYSFYAVLEDQYGNASSCLDLGLTYRLDLTDPTVAVTALFGGGILTIPDPFDSRVFPFGYGPNGMGAFGIC